MIGATEEVRVDDERVDEGESLQPVRHAAALEHWRAGRAKSLHVLM